MARIFFLLNLTTLLLCVATLFHSQSCYAASIRTTRRGKHRTLFVFGDSLFDAGNNQYINKSAPPPVTSYWPYGETFFKHATGRVSDGRIVPDFIAEFARLPILSAYLYPGTSRWTDGTNFASAGAAVLTETRFNSLGSKMDLWEQLSCFKKVEASLRQQLGAKKTREVLGRAVYLFSIGGNDYHNFYQGTPNATQFERVQFAATIIGNTTSVLKEIYALGGRKIGFQNVGPIGCLPGEKASHANITNWCTNELLASARLHNREIAIALKKLETELSGFKYSIFDYYNALKDRISNPSKFGLKEGQEACCGSGPYRHRNCGSKTEQYELCSNPSKYVWFDGGHTTEGTNYQLAQLIWSGKPNITGPYNFRQLFAL